jgi:hypothetical protein
MLNKAEFCRKRNVAIAFISFSLTCSSLVSASVPSTSSSMKDMLMGVLKSKGAGHTGAAAPLPGKPTPAAKSQDDLNTAAFQIATTQKWTSADPVSANTLSLIADSGNAAARLQLCAQIASQNSASTKAAGSINDSCLLRQFNQGSGMTWSTVAKTGTDNWVPGQALPGSFEGSQMQKDMSSHLASYGASTLDEAQTNYSVAIANTRDDYANALSAQLQKTYAAQIPGADTIWGKDFMTLDLRDGSSLTFKAGVAEGG